MAIKKDRAFADLPIDKSPKDASDKLNYYNTKITKVQAELEKKFSVKKNYSLKLSDVYYHIGEKDRAYRVSECGSYLEFYVTEDSQKLHAANFCRDRLCPMCNWRRTLKIFSQVSAVMDELKDYKFIFLTLTIRNCEGYKLSETVQAIFDGWRYLYNKNTIFRKSIFGTFRSLEVTRNRGAGTFHPHLHCILAVDANYYKHNFIKHSEWVQLWRKACKLDYDPWVYVENVKDTGKGVPGAVAEVTKYSVKAVDYATSADNVRVLSSALAARRLCGWTGVFAQVRKQLNLDDVEDGDLVHTEVDNIREDVRFMIVRYQWRSGYYVNLDTGEF